MPGYSGKSPSQVAADLVQTRPELFGFFKDNATLFRELTSVWRITIPLIVCQVLGSILGILFSHIPFIFFRLWWGGVQGGLVGFALGLAWEFSDRARRNRLHLGVILYMGFITVLLFVVGLFIPWNLLLHFGSHSTPGR